MAARDTTATKDCMKVTDYLVR